jgi:hypothetical protein
MVSFVSVSHSQYTTIQLTNNGYPDGSPQINNSGHVVWERTEGLDIEIVFYNGTRNIPLTRNDYPDRNPQLNDDGYVVWEECEGSAALSCLGGDWEIFLYDGTHTTQLTNNSPDHDQNPQINSTGHVVWQGQSNAWSAEIFLYDGTSTTRLTNDDYYDQYPQLNDTGHVVWFANPGDLEIYLYDGVSTTQLTDNDYDDFDPRTNNNGYVVWTAKPAGLGSEEYEIFLYDGVSTIQLTNNDYCDRNPQLNDSGYLVWQGRPDGPYTDYEIYLYDGTSTTQLTNNTDHDENPQINDNGHVVWEGDSEIFLYDGMSTTRLTSNYYDDSQPQLNDNGCVVWQGEVPSIYSGEEIFLAVPCSLDDDYDDDGYVSDSCGGNDCLDSNPNVYPTNPNTDCNCEDPWPRGRLEICGDGVDNDCDGTIDEGCIYAGTANAEAALFGGASLPVSGSFNALALVLVPVGAVVGWRILRRKR